MTIVLKHKRIIEFYNKYNTLDVEQMNILLIDIFEKMLNQVNGGACPRRSS